MQEGGKAFASCSINVLHLAVIDYWLKESAERTKMPTQLRQASLDLSCKALKQLNIGRNQSVYC